jgi:hypothetical protein
MERIIMIKKIEYSYDDITGNILLPDSAPFDGNPVLIKTRTGWIEAWWDKGYYYYNIDGRECSGFCWICYDDAFHLELDDVLYWTELPENSK